MKGRSIDITGGRLGRDIFLFSMPIIVSNVLQVLFNVADVAVAGRFAGAEALGSVGSTTLLVALFVGILLGIGSGINAIVARCCGARDGRSVSESVQASFLVALFVGLLFLVLGIISAEPVLTLLGTKDVLIEGAVLYFRIYSIGFPALALYNFGNGVLSAAGETKKPMLFLMTAGVINVGLNLVFVIVFEWGVAGVAAASVISENISAGLILRELIISDEDIKLRVKISGINRGVMSNVLALGIPAGMQNAIFGFTNLFIQAAVNSFSAVMVEGNSAASNADNIIYDVMAAFYVACTSFMAQNYGAWNKKRVIQSFRISLLYSFLAALILGGALVIFGREFLSIFTTEEAVIDAGMNKISVMGWSFCLTALMDCSIAASRGLGKTFVPFVILIMGSCVFRLIWIYTVFAAIHTIRSLYLLYPFSWIITGVAEYLYLKHIYRKIFST